MNIKKEINKIDSPGIRALARELDKIYPEWIDLKELKTLIERYTNLDIKRCFSVSRQLENIGIFMEYKNGSSNAFFYRLSAVNAPLGSCVDIAKRRIKRDPMSALLSLSYSQIQDVFNQK